MSPNRLYREQEWHCCDRESYCDRESCQSPRIFEATDVWLWKSDKNAETMFTRPLQEFAELYEHNALAGGQGVSEASSGYWSDENLYRKQNYLTMCTGPLMCCIDRLDVQKGYDILLEALMNMLEVMEVKAAMAAAAEFAWSNAALQYQDIFQELGVKDKLPQRGGRAAVMQETDKQVR